MRTNSCSLPPTFVQDSPGISSFIPQQTLALNETKFILTKRFVCHFYLPGDEDMVTPKAADLLRRIVGKTRNLKQRMEDSAERLQERLKPESFCLSYSDEGSAEEERKKWLADWSEKTAEVQAEIEPLLYEYFGINEQERALVEDTCDIFDKSDTPNTIDAPIPTLDAIGADGLQPYAEMLERTLHDWSRERSLSLSTTAGIEAGLGIALLKVEQTKGERVSNTAAARARDGRSSEAAGAKRDELERLICLRSR